MKRLISSLFLIAIVIFTSCTQEPISEEKGSNAEDEMIEVEIFDAAHKFASRIWGTALKEDHTARMIIRVGDYDWELTTGNHYKALGRGDGSDSITIKGNPLGDGSFANVTTFNLEGSKAVKRYLDSK